VQQTCWTADSSISFGSVLKFWVYSNHLPIEGLLCWHVSICLPRQKPFLAVLSKLPVLISSFWDFTVDCRLMIITWNSFYDCNQSACWNKSTLWLSGFCQIWHQISNFNKACTSQPTLSLQFTVVQNHTNNKQMESF